MAGNRKSKVEPPILTALYSAVEESPEDLLNLRALADWFEDQNQINAVDALHWLIDNQKYPFQYTKEKDLLHHFDGWKEGWYWWTTEKEGLDWRHSDSCRLPHRWWKKLRHTFDYDPLVFREYPTVRSAIEAFIESWARKRSWYRRTKKNEENE